MTLGDNTDCPDLVIAQRCLKALGDVTDCPNSVKQFVVGDVADVLVLFSKLQLGTRAALRVK